MDKIVLRLSLARLGGINVFLDQRKIIVIE
jgi:hypothetical protein